jgi:hypothetical protein
VRSTDFFYDGEGNFARLYKYLGFYAVVRLFNSERAEGTMTVAIVGGTKSTRSMG